MADNIIIDRASAAAGLPAPAAPLPLFPSNAKFIEKTEYRELRLALLQLVEKEDAHLDPAKWAIVIAQLWSNKQNSLTRRFAQWEPDQRNRRIRERALALISHFSTFNSAEPSEIEQLAKRLKREMDVLKEATAARLEEGRRKKKARQDSNHHHESSLGALPISNQGATAPFMPGATAVDRQRHQANANLLPANPRSVNLHHAPRNISPTDELLGEENGEGGGEDYEEEEVVEEEEEENVDIDFGANADDDDEEEDEVQVEGVLVDVDAPGDGLGIVDANNMVFIPPPNVEQLAGAAGGGGGNNGGVVGKLIHINSPATIAHLTF